MKKLAPLATVTLVGLVGWHSVHSSTLDPEGLGTPEAACRIAFRALQANDLALWLAHSAIDPSTFDARQRRLLFPYATDDHEYGFRCTRGRGAECLDWSQASFGRLLAGAKQLPEHEVVRDVCFSVFERGDRFRIYVGQLVARDGVWLLAAPPQWMNDVGNLETPNSSRNIPGPRMIADPGARE